MRNRILIGMGTSLLGGAGRVRPGSTLGTIEALSEQANAQTLHDHPDTDPSQLLALNTNLLPSVFWDKDQTSLKLPNPDGATSFFVNLAEPDAMSQVVQLLQTNGGIAPQWLVDTQSQRYTQLLHEGAGEAAIERELTAGKSGLVDQVWSQAAAIQGSAGEAADFKTQQFGSLVVHAQDAQVQGDYADLQRNNVQWLDANGDGVLDARDPAFAVVKLYMDINSDGVMQAGEGQDQDVYQLAANDRFWRTYA